jgi:hypothetical protein
MQAAVLPALDSAPGIAHLSNLRIRHLADARRTKP